MTELVQLKDTNIFSLPIEHHIFGKSICGITIIENNKLYEGNYHFASERDICITSPFTEGIKVYAELTES